MRVYVAQQVSDDYYVYHMEMLCADTTRSGLEEKAKALLLSQELGKAAPASLRHENWREQRYEWRESTNEGDRWDLWATPHYGDSDEPLYEHTSFIVREFDTEGDGRIGT